MSRHGAWVGGVTVAAKLVQFGYGSLREHRTCRRKEEEKNHRTAACSLICDQAGTSVRGSAGDAVVARVPGQVGTPYCPLTRGATDIAMPTRAPSGQAAGVARPSCRDALVEGCRDPVPGTARYKRRGNAATALLMMQPERLGRWIQSLVPF